jgi:hypothetical protein
MDSNPLRVSPHSIAVRMEEELSDPAEGGNDQASNNGAELSPLGFLLSVMKDPDATPKQRIKAVRVAARYKHVPIPPDKLPAVDEYGFSISRALAKTIGQDWWRQYVIESKCLGPVTLDRLDELSRIYARQAERDEFLQCPPGYSPKQDYKRRHELVEKRWRGSVTQWSAAEDTELAYICARITASEAGFNRTPDGRLRRRLGELQIKSRLRRFFSTGESKPNRAEEAEKIRLEQERLRSIELILAERDLTAEEERELRQLRSVCLALGESGR